MVFVVWYSSLFVNYLAPIRIVQSGVDFFKTLIQSIIFIDLRKRLYTADSLDAIDLVRPSFLAIAPPLFGTGPKVGRAQ